MEGAEEIKKTLTDKEIVLAQKQAVERGEGEEIKRRLDGLAAEMRKLQEQRDAQSARCEPKLKQRYESLRKRTSLVLVAVVGGTCKGCHMALRPQLYNQLRTSQLVGECPSCRRIIYAIERVQEETQPVQS
jgi:hypothetical protein